MLFPHFCGHFQVLFMASIRSSWAEERRTKQRQKGETTPDPTSYLKFCCVSAPVICVASDSWGDTGTKQRQISYWAYPGQSRGLNGLQGWQEKVIEAFAGGLGKEERRTEWCPLWKKYFWTENLLVVELLFSSKGQKSQLEHGAKEWAQLQQGQGQPHHGDKRQEHCRKWKDFIPISCFISNGG